MASLTCAKSATYYSASDQSFHNSKNNTMYTNENAIANTIHYVTRTGSRTDRANELIGFGCSGICECLSPEYYIWMFEMVQRYARGDRKISAKVSHEILTFTDEEEDFLTKNKDALLWYARACAEEAYYKSGFLAVFGIHQGIHGQDNENCHKRLHIHFIINNVNFENGNLFHSKIASKSFTPNGGKTYYRLNFGVKERESHMNSILYEIMQIQNPYHVGDFKEYFNNAYKLYPRKEK